MSKSVELVCDGCGKRAPWSSTGRPTDWRSLRVTDHRGAQRVFDVCSPSCASRVVCYTYDEDDRHEAVRHGLRVLPADSAL